MYNSRSNLYRNHDGNLVLLDVYHVGSEEVTLVTVYEGETLLTGRLIAYDFIGEPH